MSEDKLCLKLCCSYTTEANLMNLRRKVKHNKKVCHAHVKVPTPKFKVAVRSEVKSYLSNNSKTTEANLTKLHRKIKHNKKCVTHKS